MKKTIEQKQNKQTLINEINDRIVEVEQSHNSLVAKKQKLHQYLEQVFIFFIYSNKIFEIFLVVPSQHFWR